MLIEAQQIHSVKIDSSREHDAVNALTVLNIPSKHFAA